MRVAPLTTLASTEALSSALENDDFSKDDEKSSTQLENSTEEGGKKKIEKPVQTTTCTIVTRSLQRQIAAAVQGVILLVLSAPIALIGLLMQMTVEIEYAGETTISKLQKRKTFADRAFCVEWRKDLKGVDVFLEMFFLWCWIETANFCVVYFINTRVKHRLPFIISIGPAIWLTSFALMFVELKDTLSPSAKVGCSAFTGWLAFQIPDLVRLILKKGRSISRRHLFRVTIIATCFLTGGALGAFYMMLAMIVENDWVDVALVGFVFPFIRFSLREFILRWSYPARTEGKRILRDSLVTLSSQTFLSTPGFTALFFLGSRSSFLASVVLSFVVETLISIVSVKLLLGGQMSSCLNVLNTYSKVSNKLVSKGQSRGGSDTLLATVLARRFVQMEAGERFALLIGGALQFLFQDIDMATSTVIPRVLIALVFEVAADTIKEVAYELHGIRVQSASWAIFTRLNLFVVGASTATATYLVLAGLSFVCYLG